MHAAVDQIARPTRSLPFRPGHPSGRVGALPGSSVRGTKFLSRVISPRPRGKLLQLRLAPHITSTWRGAVDSVRGKDAPVGAILQCDHHNIAVKPGQRASFDQRGFWPVNGQVRGEHRVNVGQSRSGRRTVRAGVSRNQSLTPPRNFAARSVAVCTSVRNCLCQHATCCAGGILRLAPARPPRRNTGRSRRSGTLHSHEAHLGWDVPGGNQGLPAPVQERVPCAFRLSAPASTLVWNLRASTPPHLVLICRALELKSNFTHDSHRRRGTAAALLPHNLHVLRHRSHCTLRR
jgi:hypothetical protein